MKRILVAIDLLEATNRVIKYTKNLANKYDSKVCLVHSESINTYVGATEPEYYESVSIEIMQAHKKMIKTHMQKLEAELQSESIDCKSVIMEGPTVNNILEEIENFEPDLLILGSHKHGKFYHLIFGTIHDSLLNKTDIPLLLIPPKNEEE